MLVMIDANSLLTRIYHIIKDDYSSESLVNLFVKKVRDSAIYLKATYCFVAFTDYEHSLREECHPDYSYAPEYSNLLVNAYPAILQRLKNEKMHFVLMEGLESRDLISTVHTKLRSRINLPIAILSKEKTLYELMDKDTRFYDPFARTESSRFETIKTLNEKLSVKPCQVVDILLLSGIKKLNIGGVKGIGERKAADLISMHGDIEGLYQSRHQLSGKTGENIRQGINNLINIKSIVKSRNDVELGFNMSELQYNPF